MTGGAGRSARFFSGAALSAAPTARTPRSFVGKDFRGIDEIVGLIKESKLAASGVVFSGGEPTMQKDALVALARAARKLGFATGVQTNGVFP